MPGNYVRPPSVAETWSIADWEEYLARHRRRCEDPAEAEWAKNVGWSCVRMAEVRLARLTASSAVE